MTPARLREETQRACEVIGEITGQQVRAHRAAYFSITAGRSGRWTFSRRLASNTTRASSRAQLALRHPRRSSAAANRDHRPDLRAAAVGATSCRTQLPLTAARTFASTLRSQSRQYPRRRRREAGPSSSICIRGSSTLIIPVSLPLEGASDDYVNLRSTRAARAPARRVRLRNTGGGGGA